MWEFRLNGECAWRKKDGVEAKPYFNNKMETVLDANEIQRPLTVWNRHSKLDLITTKGKEMDIYILMSINMGPLTFQAVLT